MRKKICIFTGTRSEYGLLRPLMKLIKQKNNYKLQIIVSGMHLSPEFGLTYKEIENDTFEISEKIEMLLSSDTNIGIVKSIGLGIISFSDSLKRLNPDMLVILGDRFEALAITISAYIMKIPIAHLYGGEITEGALDEQIRHSITKMSYLHFTSTEKYRQRVIQLGEEPERVFNVGAIALDNIKNLRLLDKTELEEQLNFKLGNKNVLFTYHPATLGKSKLEKEVEEIFSSIEKLIENGYKIIITKSNADEGGRLINKFIDTFADKYKEKILAVESLGTLKYLSVIKYVDFVMGNSSSGIIEVPSFKIPTINIGNRQKGRIKGNSIVDCLPERQSILKAIEKAKLINRENISNPYDRGGAAKKIYKTIRTFIDEKKIRIQKKFYDLNYLEESYDKG